MVHRFADLPSYEISKGFVARMIHTEHMTLALVDIEAGAELPRHAHVHEQVSNVLEGEFEFYIENQVFRLGPGQSLAIPSNVPHAGRALNACRILDVFSPVREDFRSGAKVSYAKS
jgi:quercetin dioxygenase-like cupin family protein